MKSERYKLNLQLVGEKKMPSTEQLTFGVNLYFLNPVPHKSFPISTVAAGYEVDAVPVGNTETCGPIHKCFLGVQIDI